MIGAPRYIVLGLAAAFSLCHLVFGLVALPQSADPARMVLAMALFAVVAAATLWPSSPLRMPTWLALTTLGVSLALPPLVTSQLPENYRAGSDTATWYIAAIGTLLVITVVRRRPVIAWLGIAGLVIQTVLWAGPASLGTLGVTGSMVWVGVAHAVTWSIQKAARDAETFVMAERETAQWQAEQEAHLLERGLRLAQTSRMALPMLTHIVAVGGELTPAERRECLYLEGSVRDEIRGRRLLNDAVREQVMIARRRGATVTLLDEGGIDELPPAELERVHQQLAAAIRDSRADVIIVRTETSGSEVAVTVVGLSSDSAGEARALGHEAADDEEDQVELWLEIPRVGLVAGPSTPTRSSHDGIGSGQ